MADYRQILKDNWGYDNFRPLQEDIIKSVGEGRDTLGLMPTGGGKSITFQVPALAMDGICIVVTPLIALMKDQVENLKKKSIKSAAIYSGMNTKEIDRIFDNCIYGDYKFLYVSPERLATRLFLEKAQYLKVSMIAVDESHCISQWGYDFRPSYLKISEVREIFPNVPVLALTATATPEVVDDIMERLGFREKNVFKKSFSRSNLAYVVRESEDKNQQLLNILNSVPGTSVVYVRNRDKTKEIAQFLIQNGIKADYFHAGLTNSQKDNRQMRWKNGECRVIVATNAFGMGIDKADVRTVIHIDIPDSLEAYFQEAGRAGRDEKKAYAVLLYNKLDITKLKKRISDTFPTKDFIAEVYEKLAYYFQLPVEEGEGATYDFNFMQFCINFKLPQLPTFNALKILDIAGYIEFTEDTEHFTRIMFTAYRDELYNINLTSNADTVMHALLRSYTGLFADFCMIDEDLIASRTNKTYQEVCTALIELSRAGVIDYIPHKQTPFIIYKQQRVKTKDLVLGKEAYENRQERYVKRIESVIKYVTTSEVCRSQMLLEYFGEKNEQECGTCDVCINKKRREKELETLPSQILNIVSNKDVTINELVTLLHTSSEKITDAVRFLMDNKRVYLNKLQAISIRKE